MTTKSPILLLDDGELDDVRALLEEIGEPFVHLRGAEISSSVAAPTRLLITTSRRAVLAREWPTPRGDALRPQKIVVVEEDSNTLRSMLRRIGFDVLVRRPVHPYALRLVLVRALYHGRERRREARLPFGYEILVRSNLRRRSATLADISPGGCRLLSRHVFSVGSRVTLQLPPSAAGGRALALRAKVTRTRAEGDGFHAIALSFVGLNAPLRERISRLLEERVEGPSKLPRGHAATARTRPARPPQAAMPAPAPPAPARARDAERRTHKRAAFREQVLTLGERASLILMGRDISMGGMRVVPAPGLDEGVTLRLAIYGGIEEQPFLVRARVLRDDGADGVGIAFEDVAPDVAARLEALVTGLPAVESLDGEVEAMGSVVSEILEIDGP
jgi:hypothetical protein